MTTWQLAAHYASWDLRRLRWWLTMFAVLCAICLSLAAFNQWNDVATIVPVFTVIVGALLAAETAIADSAVNPVSFGVGKPLHRGVLIGVRLVTLLVVTLLIPLSIQWLIEISTGVPRERAAIDARLSFQQTIGIMSLAFAIGTASRSLRGALIGFAAMAALSVVVFVLSLFGFNAVMSLAGGDGAMSVSAVVSERARIFEQLVVYLPLIVAIWVFTTGRTLRTTRAAIGVLIFLRLAFVGLMAIAAPQVDYERSAASGLVIDSVTVESNQRYRIAYHVEGNSDTSGIVAELASARFTTTSNNRIDTIALVGIVDLNESSPQRRDASWAFRFRDESGNRSLRDQFAAQGVFIVGSPAVVRSARLDVRLPSTTFVLGPALNAPLKFGTMWQQGSRSLALVDGVDRKGRRISNLQYTERSVSSLSSLLQENSRWSGRNPLDYFEFQFAQTPSTCCSSISGLHGVASEAPYLYPGARRQVVHADIHAPADSVARGSAVLHWREWRVAQAHWLEASVMLPAR